MNTKPITTQTMESLLARTEEVGECMEWQGYVGNGSPQVSHNGRMTTVRKLMRELQGKPAGKGVFAGVNCGNPLCINPAHVIDRNMRQHGQMMASRIDYTSPMRTVKLQRAAAGRRKITDEGIAAALTDPRSCEAVAADHGVHKSLIARIRRGQAHRQVNASINPFAGLMR